MRVLFVSRGYPTPENPLSGIFELDQAKALSAAGCEITFFAVDIRSFRHKRKLGITEIQTETMKAFSISIPVGAVPMPLKMFLGKWALNRLYRKVYDNCEPPEIIHAHFTQYGFISAALAEKKHIPLVITEHSSIMGRDTVPHQILRIAEKGYSCAERVIAVSSALSRSIEKHTGIKSTVIHNIIEADTFLKENRQKHKGFHFVSVANLIPRKRINLLIEAFAAIHADLPYTTLTVIGDGPEKERLEDKAKDLGLGSSVTFTGHLSRERIAHHFVTDDCFVLPSASETFGVVYAEAMMAGLPVIASKCGGPEDFVNEKTGILREMNNPDELAAAMKDMYYSYTDYDSEYIRNYAVNSFSPDVIAQKILNIYSSVASEVTNG